jgi:pSer/pThr/pTyr-binding forkhead associated (FHA) protein
MSREQDGAAAAAAVAQLSPGPMVESPLQSPLIDIPRPAGGPSPSSSPELPLGSASDAMQASLGPAAPGGGAAAATSTAPAPPTSLTFSNTTRILPSGTEVIRVGRYSERDGHGTASSSDRIPNASPVGFKSKVVSRRHCEFWFENSKWYIKDVKSSSGTFLNHIRLSPPNTESKPYAVSDGDIVQLGIDFKGGEEMIFRCVKIRLELNRGWASRPSNFK